MFNESYNEYIQQNFKKYARNKDTGIEGQCGFSVSKPCIDHIFVARQNLEKLSDQGRLKKLRFVDFIKSK